MSVHDSIVIGAGHNGLVCAALLSRAGQKVLLLEATDTIGGLAGKREFFPGFHAPVAHAAGRFSARVAAAIGLDQQGLITEPAIARVTGLSGEGRHVVVSGAEVRGVSQADGDAYAAYHARMSRFAAALAPFWLRTIPRMAPENVGDMLTFARMGLNLRRLGKADMREFLRVFSLPMQDLMEENFESDLLKATLAWDGLVGSKMAPRSPNNAVLPLLYRMTAPTVDCTVSNLVQALERAAQAAGVEIQTGARVESITTTSAGSGGLKASGVVLADGAVIEADRVISSADPQTTFLHLLGARQLEIGFTNRIRRLRCRGLVAKLHLALDGLPDFTGLDDPSGRLLTAPGLESIERAYDDAKYGDASSEPVLEITLPTLTDSDLAPPNHHVLSAHVLYVPGDRKGGWRETERTELTDRVLSVLERFAPGIRPQVLGQELLTPADLERVHGTSGGHWHHVEMALDQMLMMRPTYEAAQYATPVPGLYLCGAGCHPGGDLTGAPGFNAAQEILR
ncbi:MAG: NAD(P)/FAD-dependent oxidoreductase [Lysobacterales bacterium]